MFLGAVDGVFDGGALFIGEAGRVIACKRESLQTAACGDAVERFGGRFEAHGLGLGRGFFCLVRFDVRHGSNGFGRRLVGGTGALEGGESRDRDHDRRRDRQRAFGKGGCHVGRISSTCRGTGRYIGRAAGLRMRVVLLLATRCVRGAASTAFGLLTLTQVFASPFARFVVEPLVVMGVRTTMVSIGHKRCSSVVYERYFFATVAPSGFG